MRNQNLGKLGENQAVNFLKKQGFKILEQNFKKKHGDIDIVALDGNTLVFIEVKTRYSKSFGAPVEAISPWKVQALVKSAYLYKLLHPDYPQDMRIDVVSVDYSNNRSTPEIELIKNITL